MFCLFWDLPTPRSIKDVPMVFMVRTLRTFWSKIQANVEYPSQAGSEILIILLEVLSKLPLRMLPHLWATVSGLDPETLGPLCKSQSRCCHWQEFQPSEYFETFFPVSRRCSAGHAAYSSGTLAASLESMWLTDDPSLPPKPLSKSL